MTVPSVRHTAESVASGRLSAVDVAREHLDRIARLDPGLGAFLHVDPEHTLEQARAVDERARQGAREPLAGVPVAVKDVMHVAGMPTTCGSRVLRGYQPPFESTAVRRLRDAGAVIVGKTNMDEFAMGSSNENSGFHPVRNPWSRDRVPGGSSGGSAAAVAAQLAGVALGSDTGGSVRQPAAFCGITGLKPTYGRVSRYGLVAFASSLDQVGVLARSAEDVALLAEVICGIDPRDATSADRPPPRASEAEGGARGLRVGVPRDFLRGLGPGMSAVFEQALADLRSLGASLVDVELPHARHAVATYYLVATAEASSNLARFDGVRYGHRAEAPSLREMYGRTRDEGFGPEVKRRIVLGTFVLSSGYYDAYYLRAQKVRTLIRRDFEQAFAACDVIATPTTPSPAFALGEKTTDPLQMYLEDVYTVPANLAGIPGLSLPCGLVDGLPVGLQLLGAPFAETTLLRAGRAYQDATAHHRALPPLDA
jgi:aspartyl-tRNA(Asn)/glutamyl-tRNA(Gln) amidotransferase subunit A